MTNDQLTTLIDAIKAQLGVPVATTTTCAEVPGGQGTDADTWDFSKGEGFKMFMASSKGIEPK